MVQFEELMLSLQALKPEIDDLSDALGMKHMLSEIRRSLSLPTRRRTCPCSKKHRAK